MAPKGQLSFEFLIYIAVSAAALVAVFSIYEASGASQRAASTGIYMQELTASINGNMAYQSSSFYAYVPPGICNVTEGPMPVSAINGFALLGEIYIANGICTNSPGIERLSLSVNYRGGYNLYG
ncbi:MAG: hypothetical protein KGH60_03265 [Candidatus Micrarchaeota archaeon]|nr:hypothetical protein [Candidatus Micrarchaeota archaeon]